ncbi:DUF7151 family protein [Ferrimonas lipolytica]|uniref:Calx-beta domain-containing protein n=1 Tax=Ferrimonas lipolytica TaxID=2724191 RepID=A0A6H1UH58_9GAMM|nr:Calx-beta domain-containing protein [Ferrimonas lipolytica]QIZ77653.1 hypothetical protein HER31_12565 [Ferrimonas lipolytica]
MKKHLIYGALITALSGCGGGESNDDSGAVALNPSPTPDNAPPTLIGSTAEPQGDNCANGGEWLQVGIDSNGDGTLTDGEITDTQLICHGANGQAGLSARFNVSQESTGENCTNGGQRVEVGLDSNSDAVLSDDEVLSVLYVCNGEQGFTGQDGFTALVATIAEPAGANCDAGGTRINSGLDSNRNNILDAEEITNTQYICHGNDGEGGSDGDDGQDGYSVVTNLSTEEPGEHCSNGGKRLDIGLDLNRNNMLDLEEITNTQYVCNGIDAPAPVDITVTSTAANEDDTSLIFTVALSEAQVAPLSINYGTVGITATAGLDFTSTAGTLVYSPGETSKTVAIELASDTLFECNETVMLALNSNGSSYSGFGQINDNGAAQLEARIDVIDNEIVENDSDATFALVFDHPVCEPVEVALAYSGSAIHGVDFNAAETVVIAAATERVEVAIKPVNDAIREERETIQVSASIADTGVHALNLMAADNSHSSATSSASINFSGAEISIIPTTAKLFGGFYANCVVTEDSLVKCWGHNGGYALGNGHDDDIGDDFGEAELTESCNQDGLNGLIEITRYEVDDLDNCSGYGGYVITQGNDDNGNGTLEDDELVSRAINRCGNNVPPYIALEPQQFEASASCPEGGMSIFHGSDDNLDGVLTTSEMGSELLATDIGDIAVISIAVGEYQSCALFVDNTVKCWGSNSNGMLGLGVPFADNSYIGDDPAELGNNLVGVNFGTGRTAISLTGGDDHFCAILDDESLRCWGNGSDGRLGYENKDSVGATPDSIGDSWPAVNFGNGSDGQPLTVKQIASGYNYNCAILSDDSLRCWGDGAFFKLGYQHTDDIGDDVGEMGANLPAINLGTDLTPLQIYSGYGTNCVIFDDGSLKCWGNNRDGQAGLGRGDSFVGDGGYESTSALCRGNEAVFETRTVMSVNNSCEVEGFRIDYGYDSNADGALSADEYQGTYNRCGVDGAPALGAIIEHRLGSSECNGNGGFEYNYGYDVDGDDLPTPEMGDNLPFVQLASSAPITKIAMGYYSTCVLFDDHTLNCWGDGDEGTTGLDTDNDWSDTPDELPSNAALPDLGEGRYAIDIAGRGYQMCALLDNLEVKCWGYSEYGEVGVPQLYDLIIGDGINEFGDTAIEMGDNLPAVELY